MKLLKVNWNGKSVKLPAEKINGKTWYHIVGETFCFATENKNFHYQGEPEDTSPGVIISPMPGKIIKTNFKLGETVKRGDTIVVLEAMKMEYSLEAGIDGIIEQLNCADGEQVQLKQKLVVIKEGNE